jgi:hypothetical protein
MLERCYSKSFHKISPSYRGCSVCEDWEVFSLFRRWMEVQSWEGKHLDKDLLVEGNKIYSPETCVFVEPSLNLFLGDHGRGRGKCLIGASYNAHLDNFSSKCCNPFNEKGSEHLGSFKTEEEAHQVWKNKKHEYALVYADLQTDPRIAKALRVRFLTTQQSEVYRNIK